MESLGASNSRPSNTKKTPEHWAAVAGLISAATGLLTFLVTFFGLPAAGIDSPTASSATATATVTATVTARGEGQDTDGENQPSSPSSNQVRWSDSLLLSGGHDLDLIPPEESVVKDLHFRLSDDSTSAYLYNADAIASVPAGETVEADECTYLAKTQNQDSVEIPVGGSACLLTDGGRTALITINSLDTTAETAQTQTTVWQK
ncbi:hypothetical protein [Streptomyces sp. NPDC020747]|uniref:hypothetical protein n=1 Tax=Streptomyces sp. NPDC020747 TaxID=3365086 RepID=UPI0037A326D2